MANTCLPTSAVQAFVRDRAPEWLAQLLHIRLPEGRVFEELIANCWLLGRVADAGNAIRSGGSYRCPEAQLGRRSFRETMQDMEIFHTLCDVLDVPLDCRITLGDVEHGRGFAVGLCLWEVCIGLQERGFAAHVPAFATPEQYQARLHSRGSRKVNRLRVEVFERAGSQEAPKLPLNMSHLLKPAPPPSERSSPCLSARGQRSRAAAAAEAAAHLAAARAAQQAPQTSEGSKDSGNGFDVLTSILSPEKNKPNHTQLINAIMRSDDATASDAQSRRQVPNKAQVKRQLAIDIVVAESAQVKDAMPLAVGTTEVRTASGTHPERYTPYLLVVSPSKRRHPSKDRQGGEGRVSLGQVLAAAGAALAAVIVVALRGSGMQTRDKQHARPAASEVHQGRW